MQPKTTVKVELNHYNSLKKENLKEERVENKYQPLAMPVFEGVVGD